MDLWLFASRFEIVKLQNETMAALIAIFDSAQPLTKPDINYIWERTDDKAELRSLAVFVLVTRVEEGNLDAKRLDQFGQLEGFTSRVYDALKRWENFVRP